MTTIIPFKHDPPVTDQSIRSAKLDRIEQQIEGLANILACMNDDPPCSRMADQVRAEDYRRIAALALSASRKPEGPCAG